MSAGPDERVVIPASWSVKLNPGGVLAGAASAFGLVGFFAPTATVGERVAWLLVAIGGLGLLVRCLVRPSLVLSTAGLEVRWVFRTAALPWDDVLALSFTFAARRGESGRATSITTSPGVPRPSVPLLVPGAPAVARAFVERHAAHVQVDPTAPWRDPQGVWRGLADEGDPIESMQTVRRASVGPWSIDVRVFDDGFEAVTTEVASGAVVRSAPRRATLAEAVADGVAQVRLAQAEL